MHKQFQNSWCAPKFSKLNGVLCQLNALVSKYSLHKGQKHLKGKTTTKPLEINLLIQPEINVFVNYHPGFTEIILQTWPQRNFIWVSGHANKPVTPQAHVQHYWFPLLLAWARDARMLKTAQLHLQAFPTVLTKKHYQKQLELLNIFSKTRKARKSQPCNGKRLLSNWIHSEIVLDVTWLTGKWHPLMRTISGGGRRWGRWGEIFFHSIIIT